MHFDAADGLLYARYLPVTPQAGMQTQRCQGLNESVGRHQARLSNVVPMHFPRFLKRMPKCPGCNGFFREI